MKTLALLFGLVFCSEVLAQFAVDKPVDSIRAPFSRAATYAASIQLEATNATSGKLELTGIATKLPAFDPFSASVLLVDIAGAKTTTIIATAVRLTVTATGGTGWEQVSPWAVRARFDAPQAIAPGQKVGCRYDMPAQTFNIVTMSWGAAGQGRLRCQPGVLAAAIPAAGSAPAPAPAPAPTPAATPSPVGACMGTNCVQLPALPQLVAADGAVFTLVNGKILRNGVATNSGYTAIDHLFVNGNGIIWLHDTAHGYACYQPAGNWDYINCGAAGDGGLG